MQKCSLSVQLFRHFFRTMVPGLCSWVLYRRAIGWYWICGITLSWQMNNAGLAIIYRILDLCSVFTHKLPTASKARSAFDQVVQCPDIHNMVFYIFPAHSLRSCPLLRFTTQAGGKTKSALPEKQIWIQNFWTIKQDWKSVQRCAR